LSNPNDRPAASRRTTITGRSDMASADKQGCLHAPGILTRTPLTNLTVPPAGNPATVRRASDFRMVSRAKP
jgi:hypothetical protein